MTKDEALKLALEALKMCRGVIRNNIENLVPIESPNPWFSQDVDRAITAIREALAQPEQEPFGYFRYDLRLDAWVQNREGQRPGTPFYTTPPQRKPLTDEKLQAIADKCRLYPRDFARAIEAAHGIKE